MAEEHFDLFAPGIIDPDQNDFNPSIKVAQKAPRAGMEPERR
jgi:hypothetical protein